MVLGRQKPLAGWDVPAWLQRWLESDSAAAGQGTRWSWDAAWPLPPWLSVLLVAALLGLILFSYLRQRRAWGGGGTWGPMLLRMAALGVLLFMVAQVVISRTRTGLPYLVVLLDDSASMQFADKQLSPEQQSQLAALVQALGSGEQEPTRFRVAQALLLKDQAAFLRWASQHYKLRLYRVAAAARLLELGPDPQKTLRPLQAQGNASRLGDALLAVLEQLRGNPPAAVVFLTDGIVTQGAPLEEAAAAARAQGVPLFIVGLGSESPVRNLAVSDLLVDDVVFRDDVVNFQFRLTAQGYAGRDVRLVLRDADRDTVLAETTVAAPEDDEPKRCQITYRPPEQGRFRFQVRVVPLEDEQTTSDNQVSRVVTVRDEKIKVLLVAGYPNFEFRHLKTMLERDTTVQLHTVLQEADWEYAQIDKTALPTVPLGREELFAYDVIIYGDVNPQEIPASTLELLREFVVVRGGGIVFVAGPRYMPAEYRGTPLEELLPVDLLELRVPEPDRPLTQPWRLQLTDLGRGSPFMQLGDSPQQTQMLWSRLAPLYWYLHVDRLKPAARALGVHPARRTADGAPMPVVCLQFVGAGRVLFHGTDETWRWRFRLGDVLFARYWVQAIRYLSRSKLQDEQLGAELTVARRRFRLGESIQFRVRFLHRPQQAVGEVVVMVQQEGGPSHRVVLAPHRNVPGVYEGGPGPLPPGDYRAWIVAPVLGREREPVQFQVQPPPGERDQLKCDFRLLARVARSTGGTLLAPEQFDRLSRLLPRGRQVALEPLPPLSLWNHWLLVGLVLGLLSAEWVWRKWQGLP